MSINPFTGEAGVEYRLTLDTDYWSSKVGKITDKKKDLIPFTFKPGQRALEEELVKQHEAGLPMRVIILKARQLGFCLSPETRVLTADLRWVPIDDLRVGDQVVATDEKVPGGKGHHRRLRVGTVEAKREFQDVTIEILTKRGRRIVATPQHRLLGRQRGGTLAQWKRVDELRAGDPLRFVVETWAEPTAEDGWLGGIIDGEGHLRAKRRAGSELCIAQCYGLVHDRIKGYLDRNGYQYRHDVDDRRIEDGDNTFGRKDVGRFVLSRRNELLRLIGQTRPVRYLHPGWWEGRELPGKRSGEAWDEVVSVRNLPAQRVIDIQTSTKTFIAEGIVSHNSTYVQARLIRACTRLPRREAVVIAHDKETSKKLYAIGERFWRNLPEDMRPALGEFRRRQHLHFAGEGNWRTEETWPDSRYTVDTANEFQAGRGSTFTDVHGSEVAFWERISQKLTAIKNGVPKLPGTFVGLESTARGFNEFKDIWDDAEAGRSNYIAFFWPWWKEEEYQVRFLNDRERDAFVIGDPNHPYAEEEPWIVDIAAAQDHEITLEQLHWRRLTIADECNGKLNDFHAEYPTTPEQAFVATGEKAFDAHRVGKIMLRVQETDPKYPTEENPGPTIGDFVAVEKETQVDRKGNEIIVPSKSLWVPRESGIVNQEAPHRSFITPEEMAAPPSEYIVNADVSGGDMEETETDEPDYHAIEVIDHKTGAQVCEYRSKIDPDLFTDQVFLAALYFNWAWVVVERTGSWGLPILRALWLDYRYPFVYRSKRLGVASESTDSKLGWDTNSRTKPGMVAGMQALIRREEDGIRSRLLAEQVLTYARDKRGRYGAEPGKYDDNIMAFMIGQEVRREIPPREEDEEIDAMVSDEAFTAANQRLGGYDPRVF